MSPSSVSLLALLQVLGCATPPGSKGGGVDTAPGATGQITGLVSLLDGAPVADAQITAAGVTTTTDASGRFSLEEVPVGDRVRVIARADGATLGDVPVAVRASQQTTVSLSLLPVELSTLDDASVGGLVESGEGVQIQFPPGAIVGPDGAPVSGAVEVATALFDDPLEIAAAPGDLTASGEGGASVPLVSGGMAFVELRQDGVVLQLGQPVTLSYPILEGAAVDDDPGLYSYDEDQGVWVHEGTGAVEDGRFTAEVSHFSYWNFDEEQDWQGCFQGRLQASNLSLDGREVGFWLTGGSHTNFVLDADGAFQVRAPVGEPVSLAAITTDDQGADHYWSYGPYTTPTIADAACLDLSTLVENGRDADGDHEEIEPWGADCNDHDAAIGSGSAEICDSKDNNCDGEVDEKRAWYSDHDLDGYGTDEVVYEGCEAPGETWTEVGGDCDDHDASASPAGEEICGEEDGVDNNCDGLTDPACGTGRMTLQIGEGAIPGARDCALYWDQTWMEASTPCPDCVAAWTVESTYDEEDSFGADNCGIDPLAPTWELGFYPYGGDDGRLMVNYEGEWFASALWATWDQETGTMQWIHQDYAYYEYDDEGTYVTSWFAGQAAVLP